MKKIASFSFTAWMGAMLLAISSLAVTAAAAAQSSAQQSDSAQVHASVGPGSVLVKTKFGGQIFGFDIDSNGTEGVLSEAQVMPSGNVLSAVETFDQTTGKILKVVKKLQTQDDFITMGISGSSVGVVEREHVQGGFVAQRIYDVLNPLASNKFTGTWTPALTKDDIIIGVSRNQTSSTSVVLAFHNGDNDPTFLFSSNIGANTNGPLITLTDPVFSFSNAPLVAYNSQTNQAVVFASSGAVGGPPPRYALVNLKSGKVTDFSGLPGLPPFRQGFVNGLALDSDDSIACTTTEVDFKVEFYNLKTKKAFAVTLPGATGQIQSGSDVEYDPVNKLFFVAQSVSSTGSGSSIQVYDIEGNLVESLNGFNFSNASNVVFTHIALNPSHRSGFVDGPDAGVTQLQSFTY
jgi:hypothetical protein